jgi:phosphatidylethanolamine/phosphatidyl-N-methylethanolamine N-methyltransferase
MSQLSIDHVIKTYRLYAPLYDWLFGAVLAPGRKALAEAVSRMRPGNILEVGVGTGLMLGQYPQETAIVGIDISSEMLGIARKRAANLPQYQIKLLEMDAEKLNFPDGFFDCVAVPYVLSVTPHPERLIAEIRRVCRKDGTIFILNHFSGSRFWYLLERAVSSLANKIGFRSDFSYDQQILKYDWQVMSVKKVNLFGLSKLLEIRNS